MEAENYIFISYSRDDEPKVTPIVKEMTNSGYHIWYDTNILPGDEWSDRIASKIEDCAVCVAFHSQASRDSPYCREEIYYARNQDKTVISVYLEDVELKKGLKMRLAPFQSVRYANPAKLVKELRKSPEFEYCRTDAPQKRNHIKSIAAIKRGWKRLHFAWKAFALLLAVALFAVIWFYRMHNPTLDLDENGILDIKSLPLSTVKMMDYNYNLYSNFNPPPWALKTPLVQCAIIRKGVTHIGNSSFQDCSNMKLVFIPESVTSIGDSAFSGCTALKEISLPDSLESLGMGVFSGCTGLEKIRIPSIKKISDLLFSGCTGLKSVEFTISLFDTSSENVTYIGLGAFENCTGLESIYFPNSVVYIEVYAFAGCTALKRIWLPNDLMVISYHSFENCTALEEITIPSSVRGIYLSAFSGCSNLKTVHIQSAPERVQILENVDRDSIVAPDTMYIDATAFDPGTKIIFEPPDADADVVEYIWGSD